MKRLLLIFAAILLPFFLFNCASTVKLNSNYLERNLNYTVICTNHSKLKFGISGDSSSSVLGAGINSLIANKKLKIFSNMKSKLDIKTNLIQSFVDLLQEKNPNYTYIPTSNVSNFNIYQPEYTILVQNDVPLLLDLNLKLWGIDYWKSGYNFYTKYEFYVVIEAVLKDLSNNNAIIWKKKITASEKEKTMNVNAENADDVTIKMFNKVINKANQKLIQHMLMNKK